MSFTRLPPPGDRPALLNAPRETLLIRVSRCHLWLLRLLSQPAPPWPQEWLLQAAAPASLSARRVQPLEPIRSLLAPTPEQTVLIAATLAKPVSQSAPTPRPSPKSAEKAQLSYSWIPCPISFILGTLARAVSRSVKIPLATTAQPFLVSTITPVRSAT